MVFEVLFIIPRNKNWKQHKYTMVRNGLNEFEYVRAMRVYPANENIVGNVHYMM